MTIAELLAFDVAPAVAPLHIELSKDELTQYSTLSSTRGRREGKQLLTSKRASTKLNCRNFGLPVGTR